jgi:uncharacterized protein
MLTIAVMVATLAQAPACWNGIIGEGPRAPRVIAELGADGTAIVHLYRRPPRQLVLPAAPAGRAYATVDGTTSLTVEADDRVRLQTVAAGETMSALLRPVGGDGRAVAPGEWSARVGPGGVIRLIARVEPGPCGTLIGLFDSPDQGQTNLPTTAASVSGDTLLLEASYIDLRIAIPLHGGEERNGTMLQGGVAGRITFRRGLAQPRRPQQPILPLPYAEREVTIASRANGIRLTGALTLPDLPGPHPAVVFISGSGAQDRDETIAGHRPFLVLSDRLTRLGYAVLRVDDRGVGGSTGNVLQSDLADLADDVRGMLDFLERDTAIDAARIGLLGHSEGEYIASIVAADNPRVRFLVLLGAPALSGMDALLAQRAAIARVEGTAEREVRFDSLLIRQILDALATAPPDERIAEAVDSALAVWLQGLPPHDRGVVTAMLEARTAAADSQSVALWRSRWFKGLLAHDPAHFLERTDAPVFALIGRLDQQVPFEPNVRAFESIYASRQSLLTLHTPPGVNHMLKPAVPRGMAEYADIDTTIAPIVLQLLETWITTVVPVPHPPTPHEESRP